MLPGAVYLLTGIFGGHFRSHVWPKASELAPHLVWRDLVNHLRFRIPPASGGPHYGLLQKCAYSLVIFVAAPLMVVTGLAMSPAVTAAFPFLLRLFGGYQSARTIHFCRLRCAPVVRGRARRDGHQVRIQTSDPGHDRGGMR